MVSASPIDALRADFPLTFPIPTPLNSSDVVTVRDIQREEDLLRNPFSFRSWWIAIQAANDSFNARIKTSGEEPGPSVLGPLAHPLARTALKRLTYLYESVLVHFPGSFKLWKAYLQTRMNYVLGPRVVKKRAGGKRKFADMKDALEEEKEDLEEWTGGLDPIVGWEEWKALVATFERALMWLPKVRPNDISREFPLIPTRSL
jgi:pre-mRNA-splicing factor SYF1